MTSTRRDFCVSSLLATFAARAFAQQTSAPNKPLAPIAAEAVPFDEIPVRKAADGRETRPCLNGLTPNVQLEMHQTTLPPGKMPHPPHRHAHDELFLVRAGTVTVTIADQPKVIGPGGYAIVVGGVEHGVKNTGAVSAEYFVVALNKLGSSED